MLVLTSIGRLERFQKTGNIWQVLCQDLEKDDLRSVRALNPCESMRNLTGDESIKNQRTLMRLVSAEVISRSLLMTTQAWLEKVTHVVPRVIQRVCSSPIKTEWFETRVVQGTHTKYSED